VTPAKPPTQSDTDELAPLAGWRSGRRHEYIGGELLYDTTTIEDAGAGPGAVASRRFVEDFARLAHIAEAEFGAAVVAFADEYGPLRICEHDKAASHRPAAVFGKDGCFPRRRGTRFYEPGTVWRMYARRIGALRSLAVNLASNRPGASADWRVVLDDWQNALGRDGGAPIGPPAPAADARPAYGIVEYSGESDLATQLGIERAQLNRSITDLMDEGGVRVKMRDRGPEIVPAGLLGALAFHVALGVRGIKTVKCAACGRPTVPLRSSKTRGSYCDDCRADKKKMDRIRQRAWRAEAQHKPKSGNRGKGTNG
jgi:hypothetical protein